MANTTNTGAAAKTWTYEGYWNAVLGAQRDADGVVRDFDLDPNDRVGLDEWLGIAEAEAWRVGAVGGDLPVEWADHHVQALGELVAVEQDG